MALALAAADVTDPDKARRLLAVGVLSGSTDLRVRSLLQARLGQGQDSDVKAAITQAFDRMPTKINLLGYGANTGKGKTGRAHGGGRRGQRVKQQGGRV